MASSCPGLCTLVAQGDPESQGSGGHRVLGAEGGPAWLESRLNGFLWPLSRPCLVSLGGVYLGACGEEAGREEEEGAALAKGTQECVAGGREREEGGDPILGRDGTSRTPD